MHFILYIEKHSEQGSKGFSRLSKQSRHRKGQGSGLQKKPAEALRQAGQTGSLGGAGADPARVRWQDRAGVVQGARY